MKPDAAVHQSGTIEIEVTILVTGGAAGFGGVTASIQRLRHGKASRSGRVTAARDGYIANRPPHELVHQLDSTKKATRSRSSSIDIVSIRPAA